MASYRNRLIGVIVYISLFAITVPACTLPTALQETWLSSAQGSLTFNSTHIVAYTIEGSYGDLAFECYTTSGDYYVFKSQEFYVYSSAAYALLCISFTNIKTNLYRYTVHTEQLVDADYQRIRFVSSSTTITASEACTDTSHTEYSLLAKDGEISSLKTSCPDNFLGTFTYSYGDSYCTNMTGALEVCSDTTLLDFNLTACSTAMVFSSGGQANCLYSTESGDTSYVHVYNLDNTTDESTTYRFTCFVIEASSDGYVYATDHPQDCHTNQTATYVPSPGSNFTLLPSVTCVPEVITEATPVSQAGLIAGLVFGFIIIILIILLILGWCWWKKKKALVDPIGKAPMDTESICPEPIDDNIKSPRSLKYSGLEPGEFHTSPLMDEFEEYMTGSLPNEEDLVLDPDEHDVEPSTPIKLASPRKQIDAPGFKVFNSNRDDSFNQMYRQKPKTAQEKPTDTIVVKSVSTGPTASKFRPAKLNRRPNAPSTTFTSRKTPWSSLFLSKEKKDKLGIEKKTHRLPKLDQDTPKVELERKNSGSDSGFATDSRGDLDSVSPPPLNKFDHNSTSESTVEQYSYDKLKEHAGKKSNINSKNDSLLRDLTFESEQLDDNIELVNGKKFNLTKLEEHTSELQAPGRLQNIHKSTTLSRKVSISSQNDNELEKQDTSIKMLTVPKFMESGNIFSKLASSSLKTTMSNFDKDLPFESEKTKQNIVNDIQLPPLIKVPVKNQVIPVVTPVTNLVEVESSTENKVHPKLIESRPIKEANTFLPRFPQMSPNNKSKPKISTVDIAEVPKNNDAKLGVMVSQNIVEGTEEIDLNSRNKMEPPEKVQKLPSVAKSINTREDRNKLVRSSAPELEFPKISSMSDLKTVQQKEDNNDRPASTQDVKKQEPKKATILPAFHSKTAWKGIEDKTKVYKEKIVNKPVKPVKVAKRRLTDSTKFVKNISKPAASKDELKAWKERRKKELEEEALANMDIDTARFFNQNNNTLRPGDKAGIQVLIDRLRETTCLDMGSTSNNPYDSINSPRSSVGGANSSSFTTGNTNQNIPQTLKRGDSSICKRRGSSSQRQSRPASRRNSAIKNDSINANASVSRRSSFSSENPSLKKRRLSVSSQNTPSSRPVLSRQSSRANTFGTNQRPTLSRQSSRSNSIGNTQRPNLSRQSSRSHSFGNTQRPVLSRQNSRSNSIGNTQRPVLSRQNSRAHLLDNNPKPSLSRRNSLILDDKSRPRAVSRGSSMRLQSRGGNRNRPSISANKSKDKINMFPGINPPNNLPGSVNREASFLKRNEGKGLVHKKQSLSTDLSDAIRNLKNLTKR